MDETTHTFDSTSVDLHARTADALAKLGICVKSVAQYGRAHPVILDMITVAHVSLAELLVVQPMVSVASTGSCLALDSFPIADPSGCLSAFATTLNKRGITEMRISAGITRDELSEFAEALSLSPEDIILHGGIANDLIRRGVEHIVTRSGVLPVESREGRDPADIYEEALALIEDALRAVQNGLSMPVAEIRGVVADSLRSLIDDDSALLALSGIRSYDRYLSEHSVNVCILSMVLGRDLGLDSSSTLELGLSALLHDVGKVFVPAEIVKKPGRLTEEEWMEIRRHPAEGARALAGLPDLPALASTIALEHHARAGGAGYPALPAQQKPHLLSRLVAIVDTYDALTTDRPYRERWTPQQTIAWMLYEASGQYDRQLMARFAARARLHPIGSLLRLKRGDYAIVIGGHHDSPYKPTLRLVTGEAATDSAIIDLTKNTDPGLEIDSMAQPVEVLLPYADRLVA